MQQNLPVLSCVLYLAPKGTVPSSPLRWEVPGWPTVLTFHFESIQVAHLLPQDLMSLDSMELLTLLPLTDGGASQPMLEYMLQTLRQHGDRELEVIGLTFATLKVSKDIATTRWLKERYKTMEEDLFDIPLFQETKEKMRKKIFEEVFSEGQKAGEQLGLQRGEQLGEQRGEQLGLQRGEQLGEQRGRINTSRQIIISIVEQGFPNLLTLAQQRIEQIEDPLTLQSVVVHLALASTEEQARQALLS